MSSERIKDFEAFKYQTVYQNDYKKSFNYTRLGQIKGTLEEDPPVQTEYQFYDHQNFQKWRFGARVPLELYTKPENINRINPHEPFSCINYVTDKHKEDIIKSRPRVYMSPAVSIDDIGDPGIRQLLCNNTYTTDWRVASNETTDYLKVQRQKGVMDNHHPGGSTVHGGPEINCSPDILTKRTFIGDPVNLKSGLNPPPILTNESGKDWEAKQLRAGVDPTAEFWINKEPSRQEFETENLVSEEMKEKIRSLIKEDKLCLAYDSPIPGYAGYIPRTFCDVPLEKSDFPRDHPLLSVTQASNTNYLF